MRAIPTALLAPAATVTADRIADAIGVTRRRVSQIASEESWFHKTEAARGGWSKHYFVAALPEPVRAKVEAVQLAEQLAAVEAAAPDEIDAMIEAAEKSGTRLPIEVRRALCERELGHHREVEAATAPTTPALGDLTTAQRATAEARLALLREIDRLAAATTVMTAISRLSELAASARLAPRLMALLPVANARDGEGRRTISPRTLKRWRAAYKAGGFAALAPGDTREAAPPPWWADGFLRHYRRPQKPAITEALEAYRTELAEVGRSTRTVLAPPSYDQCKSLVRKLGAVERQRGRRGPRDLKNLKPYVKRDDSDLAPLDVALIDGHTYDAEVAHPDHGGPFRPEITTMIDAKTRLGLGFSLDLAESAQAVANALRDGVLRFGVPAWLYTDRGSGYEAEVTSGAATGLLSRLGISHMTSLPYNSQARGRSERAHATIWVRSARQLPTYVGARMDEEAKHLVHKATRRDLAGKGRRLLMPWAEFVAWARAQFDAYNRRPHRSLAKLIDAETGLRRHQSPIEAYRAAIEAGWSPERVDEATADDLFRPVKLATTRRGTVTLRGNEYFHPALTEYGGARLQVAYEPTDPAWVWVRDAAGRLICKAALDGHKRGYMPVSMLDQGRIDRVQSSLKRLDRDREQKRLELPGATIDGAAMTRTPVPLTEAQQQIQARIEAEMATPVVAEPDPTEALQRDLEAEMARSATIVNLPATESKAARFRRAMQIAGMIGDGHPVRQNDRWWWENYTNGAEYNGIYSVWEEFGELALASLE